MLLLYIAQLLPPPHLSSPSPSSGNNNTDSRHSPNNLTTYNISLSTDQSLGSSSSSSSSSHTNSSKVHYYKLALAMCLIPFTPLLPLFPLQAIDTPLPHLSENIVPLLPLPTLLSTHPSYCCQHQVMLDQGQSTSKVLRRCKDIACAGLAQCPLTPLILAPNSALQYKTWLGNGGTNLSRGQQQWLAIAHVIL